MVCTSALHSCSTHSIATIHAPTNPTKPTPACPHPPPTHSLRKNVALTAGIMAAGTLSAASALAEESQQLVSTYVPGPVEVGWQIWAGAIAGVIPFAIGAYEFGKRIIIQRQCARCQGSGLVQRGRYLRKCPDCGGFFPWQSWGQFLSATATPGNGGPLLQPRGQDSVLYKVPKAPSEEERAAIQEQEVLINARLAEREAEQAQQQRDGRARALGCRLPKCALCRYCQKKFCTKESGFNDKYLVNGDCIEARCGAPIRVQVYDTANERIVYPNEPMTVRFCILDGLQYEKFPAGTVNMEKLDACRLFFNKKGKELLALPKGGKSDANAQCYADFMNGSAILPDMRITDSSEAMLGGKQPNFYLYAVALLPNGQPAPITPAVSEAFVVATQRTKPYIKMEIPHINDSIERVKEVGSETKKKLSDLRAAANKAGIQDLAVPQNTVTKVGELKELVMAAERNKVLRENLKQLLRLTKGWDTMRDHVMMAVDDDVQLRVWYADSDGNLGIVFQCGAFNAIDLNNPVGVLRRTDDPSGTLVNIHWSTLQGVEAGAIQSNLNNAVVDWSEPEHPGWFLLPAEICLPDLHAIRDNTAGITSCRVMRPCDCPQLGSLPKSPRTANYGVPVAGPTIGPAANPGFGGMQINSGELFAPSRLVTSGQLPLVDAASGKSLNVGMEDPFATYDNVEGALIPPNSGGFAAVGDRRLESVPTTLPSFSAQQQQQPFATDVAFGMTYNVPTALGTPYMAQGQPMAPQEMSSLPLVQQFLAHRASTPEYSVHTAGSSPFVEPGAEGGGVAGPSWIAPRASHMSVVSNASQPSPFEQDDFQSQLQRMKQEHMAAMQGGAPLPPAQPAQMGAGPSQPGIAPFNSLLASRQPDGKPAGAPMINSDEFGNQLSMVVSSLLKWSEQDASLKNDSGIVTRERTIQRLTRELHQSEENRGAGPSQPSAAPEAVAPLKPEVLRTVITDLQQGGAPDDDLATVVHQLSMAYPEFDMDGDFGAMGSLMSLGSLDNMQSLRSALPSQQL